MSLISSHGHFELLEIVASIRFTIDQPLVDSLPALNTVGQNANNIIALFSGDTDDQEGYVFDLGFGRRMSILQIVATVQMALARGFEENPDIASRPEELKAKVSDLLQQLPGEAMNTEGKKQQLLREFLLSLKSAYSVTKEVEAQVHSGLQYLLSIEENGIHDYIRYAIPQMTDEQLGRMGYCCDLIVKQIVYLQRMRSSEITGLYRVCEQLNIRLGGHVLTGNLDEDMNLIY